MSGLTSFITRAIGRRAGPVREKANLADLNARGASALAAGDAKAAERAYRLVLDVAPDNVDALANLGCLFEQLGEFDRAEPLLEHALRVDAVSLQASLSLGNLRRLSGRLDDASALYRTVIAAAPDEPGAHYNLGLLLLEQGDVDGALAELEWACRLAPDVPGLHVELGRAYQDLGRWEEAESRFERALELDPDSVPAITNLGLIHRERGRLDLAEAAFRRADELSPDNAPVLSNLAGVHQDRGELEAAVESYRRAIDLSPDFVDAHSNLAGALAALGRFEAASDAFERALQLDPQFQAARWNRALMWLTLGELEAGWREHEWGLVAGDRVKRDPSYPRWRDEPLSGKTILVLAEQGIGDEIMFSSCLPDFLENASPARCVVECDPRLSAIFTRSFPGIETLPRWREDDPEWRRALEPIDLQVSIGSLPMRYRNSLASFPRRDRFLHPDPSRIADWRSRLDALGCGIKVGISWRGGGQLVVKRARSTLLSQWRAVLEIDGVHFVNVQYGDTARERAELRSRSGVDIAHFEEHDPITDMDGLAALTASLDLVVSVDNSTVHMAGAVGTEVWTLLPKVPDWRWMLAREDTPWYPDMRLYRQGEANQWEEVFDRVARDLAASRCC